MNASFRVLVILLFLTSCSVGQQERIDVEKDSRYNAVTWVQNSAEYKCLTTQTFRMAQTQLNIALNDPKWSADEVQVAEGGYEEKTPAVILDVDETVLDNSSYNARNITTGQNYTTASWNAWCQEAKATPIPGALEFARAAKGMGIEVFYITNRHDDVREATLNNLKATGFPVDEAHLLTKNSEQGRDGNKISRRATVCKTHRVLLLIGDNLSDLFSGMDVRNTKRRNEIALEKHAMLGSRWIVLPNPVYGGWERALPDGKKALNTQRAQQQTSEEE